MTAVLTGPGRIDDTNVLVIIIQFIIITNISVTCMVDAPHI